MDRDLIVAIIGLSSMFGFFIFVIKLGIDIYRKRSKKIGTIGIFSFFILFIIALTVTDESPEIEQSQIEVIEKAVEKEEVLILTNEQKNILKKNYGVLSSTELSEVREIERYSSKYSEDDQKIITKEIDILDKEKVAFDENEREIEKEIARKEKKEDEAKKPVENKQPVKIKQPVKAKQEPLTNSGGTLSQKNAVSKAKDYLSYTSFSKSGLIKQLEYEGFSNSDATYALSQITVDWKAQALNKGKDYLNYTSFSRSGLIDQLQYEGFSLDFNRLHKIKLLNLSLVALF